MNTTEPFRPEERQTAEAPLLTGSQALIESFLREGVETLFGYPGGAIIPGVNLSYGALAAGTSLLPSISITAPKKVIATNTVDSMRSGAVYGTAAMLDGMIERMEAELDAGGIRVGAKYRYRQKDQAATLTRDENGQMLLTFDEPQRAIAPGQAVVVYRGDVVLGGGTVTGALK